LASSWQTLLRAGLAPQPAVVDRVAVHLAAGRASLAQRMLAREKCPADVPADVWAHLQNLVAWQAGAGPEPPLDALRVLSTRFRSLAQLLDTAVGSAPVAVDADSHSAA
jgi:hypothetical protein